MLLRVTAVILALATFGLADTLTLRDGRVVRGEYIGGDARHVKMAVGDRVDTYAVDEVDSLQFGNGQRSQAAPPPAAPTGFAQQPAPSNVSGLQLAIGTPITIRMIDGVNSEEARLGQTFHASVDEPVVVNGQTVIPRGADALTKLVQDQQSGKFEGRTVLTLVLQEVMINGRMVDITTGDVSEESKSRGSRTAKVVGGTTAVGAIIGAIAGGGKGAAIGAASGAAVGGGAQAVTKGQVVKIPSETRLTFTLQQPVQL
ncbi:MAG TPA: hypothetical protein VEV17_25870 [Bryobacteraceae bacterium]|nr:hypothetical protein [Bryobacteraceae bacterium]